MSALHQQFGEAYGPPCRVNSATGPVCRYQIDDQGADDRFPGFCRIFVTVTDNDDDAFTLELENAPHNPTVADLVKKASGEFNSCPMGATIKLRLRPRDRPVIRELAQAICRVTARGQRYAEPNWKWLAPRTADSLERLASVLKHKTRR